MKLKRCPFCNCHNLHLDMNQTLYWIACLECGSTGPNSLSKDTACELWNGECRRAGYTSLVTMANGSNRDQKKEIEL